MDDPVLTYNQELDTQEDIITSMEEILDKLRLLNYQKEFLHKKLPSLIRGMKPLNRAYFVVQTNPNQQFNYFKTLVKWLFSINEVNIQDFSKYEDPMTVSSNIQSECKKISINCDYPPIKLKSGSGEQVVTLINNLLSRALKVKKIANLPKPRQQISKDVQQEVVVKGDEKEDQPQQLAEVIQEQEQMFHDGGQFGFIKHQQQIFIRIDQDKQVIQSNINQKQWILQVERASKKLKLPNKTDQKQWRNHIDSTRQCGQTIKKNLPVARGNLQKMNDDLGKTLQKIGKAQKNINTSMSGLGSSYKQQSQSLKTQGLLYNNLNNSIKQMNQQYRAIGQKFQTIEKKIEEHGSEVSDNSRVVKLKAAMQKVSGEIKYMDVRIGILNHSVMQHRFRQKRDIYEGNILDQFDEN